nr:MAG TPA: hypothetical protein [Caudoviricetes sp.]
MVNNRPPVSQRKKSRKFVISYLLSAESLI